MSVECAACNGDNVVDIILKNVEEYGVSVMGTEIEIDGGMLPMTYSIGITKSIGKPEIVIFGVNSKHAQTFINMYSKFAEKNAIEIGKEYFDFAEGYPTMFTEVTKDQYKENLCQARFFNEEYGVELKAVQLVYPDVNRNWPWQEVDEVFKKTAHVLNPPQVDNGV